MKTTTQIMAGALALFCVMATTASAATVLPQATKVTAQGSAGVELFINGQALGKVTSGDVRIRAMARSLVLGDNVIVFRARKGSSTTPYLFADLAGQFGRAGSSALWKAKTASTIEGSQATGSWTTLAYDDSAWGQAKVSNVRRPAGFPVEGSAQPIWASSSTSNTVLFRLKLYVPNIDAAVPAGHGQGVTGGANGETVRVSTPAELAHALCRSSDGQGCTDSEPRIIEVASSIDFRNTEGTLTDIGCYQAQCKAPMASELILEKNATVCTGNKFNITYDKAGPTPMLVGSNKTLIGVGPSAAVLGKGLKLSGGVSNIIIRNMTFAEINPQLVWGGDALRLSGADRVWIDHNRFWRVGRQMIVSNFEGASNVTISWNDFDGTTPYSARCDGTHYWVLLILGAKDTITLNNNWIHDFSGRAPHVGGNNATVSMHLANNYFQRGTGHAINPDTGAVKVLAEGNYFKDVVTPILMEQTNPGYVFAPVSTLSSAHQSACTSALGRSCALNKASPMPSSGVAAFPLDTLVLDTLGTAPAGTLVKPYAADKVPMVVPHLAGPGRL